MEIESITKRPWLIKAPGALFIIFYQSLILLMILTRPLELVRFIKRVLSLVILHLKFSLIIKSELGVGGVKMRTIDKVGFLIAYNQKGGR